MNFIFNQRNKRRISVVVLFVWMMSLMVGFANACAFETEHLAQRHALVVSTHAHESDGQSSNAEHSQSASVAAGACESFCSEQETGILKHSEHVVPDVAGAVPLLIQTWTNPAISVVTAQYLDDGTPHWLEPPVRIRYQRLTI